MDPQVVAAMNKHMAAGNSQRDYDERWRKLMREVASGQKTVDGAWAEWRLMQTSPIDQLTDAGVSSLLRTIADDAG